MIKIRKGRVGRNAYKVSKVWDLGFHRFINEEDLIIRICYLRTNTSTHYCQLSIKVKKECDCRAGEQE